MDTLKKLMEHYYNSSMTLQSLTLVPTNKIKVKIKKYEELWIKIRDLKNSNDYDEKYLKTKFDSDMNYL